MKKPLLIGVSALVLLASATFLFAQTTTGSSLITEMKAAVRVFTLAGDLNPPGSTGLQSAPVSGKKTGDMLTAEEYNRILELVGQGGGGGSDGGFTTTLFDDITYGLANGGVKTYTCPQNQYVLSVTSIMVPSGQYSCANSPNADKKSVSYNSCAALTGQRWHTHVICGGGGGGSTGGGGSGWVDVPLTDTNPFDQQCMYRFVTQGQTYYAETVHEDKLYWINSQHFTKTNKSVLVFGTAPYNTATKMEKFCGGGGGGGGFNWDMCVPEWVGTPTTGVPYTNAAGLKCKYTGTGGASSADRHYYLCCPGA